MFWDYAKQENDGHDICPSLDISPGNAQTLKDEPREKNINTYERLREFWRRFYSAHYMTLTVQSRGNENKSFVSELIQYYPHIYIKGLILDTLSS